MADEDGENQAQDEEERAKINCSALKDVGGSCTEDLVGNSATECRAKTFLFRALHEDDQSHQQTDDDKDHQQEIDANVEPVDRSESHGRGTMGGLSDLVKRRVSRKSSDEKGGWASVPVVRDGQIHASFIHLATDFLPMRIVRFFAYLFLLCGLLLPTAGGHQVASVELEFLKLENEWRLEGQMDIAYMLPETRNVPGGLPLSREAVMKYPPEELARIRRDTEATLRMLLKFTFADQEVKWRVEYPDFEKDPFELPEEAGDIALLTTRLILEPLSGAGELRVHWSGEQETELIILFEEADEPDVISTLPGGSLMLLKQHETGVRAPVEKPVTGGWLQSGYRHVLPWGLDHLLFIVGLFLLVPKWKPLMVQSLLFTLAHSITLACSVIGKVVLPGKPVEILIAVSIAWIGIENLMIKKLGKQRLILVFCFGLLHGLGYASWLGEKLKSIPRDQLAGPLIGFNVGVELAQITVLVICFVLLLPLKRWTLQVQTVGSVFIALAGLGWVVERLFVS